MKRPETHEIDTLGRTQLRTAFDSLGWTVNPVDNDYGVDFEVEAFHKFRGAGQPAMPRIRKIQDGDYR